MKDIVMNANVTFRLAESSDLDQLADLFDQYRQYYISQPDLSAAKKWIAENFERGRSTIFAADDGDQLVGFTQLYPALCSVDLVDYFVLYDLFVAPSARRQGMYISLLFLMAMDPEAEELHSLQWIHSTRRYRRFRQKYLLRNFA